MSGLEDEVESFSVDSTADLIYLHLCISARGFQKLIFMAERALFGPLQEA